MTRLAAWIAIALLCVYLVFFGGGWAGLYRTDLRLFSVLSAAVAGGVWAVAAWRSPAWRPRSVLLPAIIVVIATLAVSTASSRFPRQSIEYLGYAVTLAGLYLLLVRLLANPFFRARMGPLTVGLALVLGLGFAVANLSRWIHWWSLVGRLAVPPLRPESESLTFGNPSTALTIVLLFSIAGIAFLGIANRGPRVVVGLLVVLAAFATLASGSRAGWLAIGITIIVTAVLVGSMADSRRVVREWLIAWSHDGRRRFALAVGGLGAVGAFLILAPVIIRRATDSGVDLRFNYLLAAQRMFAESPLAGTGPGTWVIQRITYTISPETDYYIPHAHNVYAQTVAELGIVGVLAGGLLFATLALLVRDALRDPDVSRRRWGWAAAVGLTYFAAHQLLDFYPNMAAILFAAALPVAWLDASATRPIGIRGRSMPMSLGRVPTLIGALLFAIASIGLVASEMVAAVESSAVDLANDGDWAAADLLASEAVARDPGWGPYQMTMGLTAASVGDHQRAAAAFATVAGSDDLPEAWLDLAAEQALLGRPADALASLDRAARLGLQRPALAMAIGDLAFRLGNTGLSETAFTNAIAMVPSLAGDPWWHADSARAARFPALIDAAIEMTDEFDRWQIPLMAGDIDRARGHLMLAFYGPGTLVPDDVVEAWAGDGAALQRILDLCDAYPLNTTALGWAARLEARRGDDKAVNRYLAWAYTVSSGALEAGTELRVSDRPKLGRTAQGGVAEFWGAYSYRRFTPWNLLVPSVVQLTID